MFGVWKFSVDKLNWGTAFQPISVFLYYAFIHKNLYVFSKELVVSVYRKDQSKQVKLGLL